MYSTSSPDTRVLWAAHSYNVAYSDEIGHFEYCNRRLDANREAAPRRARTPPIPAPDSDDVGAQPPHWSNARNANFSGCLGRDGDFDGPEYATTGRVQPRRLISSSTPPRTFTSPLFTGPGNSGLRNYQQAAFETNLPRIEGSIATNPLPAARLQPVRSQPWLRMRQSGRGASFYPIFSTVSNGCVWEEGEAHPRHHQ